MRNLRHLSAIGKRHIGDEERSTQTGGRAVYVQRAFLERFLRKEGKSRLLDRGYGERTAIEPDSKPAGSYSITAEEFAV